MIGSTETAGAQHTSLSPAKGLRAERGYSAAANRSVLRWATSGRGLLLLVAALFVLNVVLHFPGTMDNDSKNQYAEAIAGRYTDWHPPVMAWLWSVLRLVADGPALKLAQSALARVGRAPHAVPDPLPPGLVGLWHRHLRLESETAQRDLDIRWTPYGDGLRQSAQWYLEGAHHAH